MKKPLKACINGDGRPVQPPSKVLCEWCLKKLDAKIRGLLDPPKVPAAPGEETKP